MEALLDFFDPTEEVDQPSASPKAHQDSLPSSLPPEVSVNGNSFNFGAYCHCIFISTVLTIVYVFVCRWKLEM